MCDYFRKTVSLFRKGLPPALPVSVRKLKLKGLDGYCHRAGDRFVIAVNKGLGERMAVETLIHEWAHARAWNLLDEKAEPDEFHRRIHGAAWGVAYAEVYRLYEEHLTNGGL